MEYRYYISYVFFKGEKLAGYGDCVASQNTPIYDVEYINKIKEKLLEENPDWTGVTILNWKRFEED